MVSMFPDTQSYNFTHMFNIKDLNSCIPRFKKCPNSLSGLIQSHPDFSKFYSILKLANLDDIYNDPQANFTLFVPSDNALANIDDSVFKNMDISTARHIVKTSTLDRKIPSELLENSPASYFITKDSSNRLFITNIRGRTYIDTNINVIHKDMEASNGIIHVIDGLIRPEII
jgi:uncharacterized surface protein with fasciclin (FAS1) repeats